MRRAVATIPRRPDDIGLAQFEAVRGIKFAFVKSARSSSPACNCCGSIKAWPSRPRRRASHASGLSDLSTVTLARPKSVDIGRYLTLRQVEMLAAEVPAHVPRIFGFFC